MKTLIVSGHPHIPQRAGGVESSTHDLALELCKRGHDVSVLCGLTTGGGLASLLIRVLRKLSIRPFPADRWLGYPVYRQWRVLPNISRMVREFAPDVAIVQIGMGEVVDIAREISACGVPVLFYLRNVEIEELGGDPRTLTDVHFIANSQFTARRYNELFGICATVIPPLVHAERYTSKRRPSNVTFINPYLEKGREIALEIAKQCPEIPFSFIESWSLSPKDLEELGARIDTMPNVSLRRRTGDMRGVYSRAKIVLVPSMWEEAWGRVATEAQFSGIPVVASNLGGLPEAVGPGGVLLDPTGPIGPWIETVRRLWSDDAFYREKSAAALAYSRRPEIDPGTQIDALLAAASTVMTRSGAAANPAGRPCVVRPTLELGGVEKS